MFLHPEALHPGASYSPSLAGPALENTLTSPGSRKERYWGHLCPWNWEVSVEGPQNGQEVSQDLVAEWVWEYVWGGGCWLPGAQGFLLLQTSEHTLSVLCAGYWPFS